MEFDLVANSPSSYETKPKDLLDAYIDAAVPWKTRGGTVDKDKVGGLLKEVMSHLKKLKSKDSE